MSRVARFIDSALAVSSYSSAGINITLINPGRLLIDLTYYFFTYSIINGGRSASSTKRKSANLWTKKCFLDLETLRNVASFRLALCGPSLFCDLRTQVFADLRLADFHTYETCGFAIFGSIKENCGFANCGLAVLRLRNGFAIAG
jgi:hypothetical protein